VLVVTSKRDLAGAHVKTADHPSHLAATQSRVVVVIRGNTVQRAAGETGKRLRIQNVDVIRNHSGVGSHQQIPN